MRPNLPLLLNTDFPAIKHYTQETLQVDYKRELMRHFGIRFKQMLGLRLSLHDNRPTHLKDLLTTSLTSLPIEKE